MTAPLPPSPRAGRLYYRVRVAFVLVLWLLATAWLIRFEACPHRFTGRLAGYRELFREGIQIRDSWMRILMDGVHVGYAHTTMDLDETDPVQQQRIQSAMELDLNLMGANRRISSRMEIALDMLSRLQTFSFRLQTEGYVTEINARRREDGLFAVIIDTPAGSTRLELDIPDDVVLHSPLLEQSLAELAPGQSRVFRTLDPASLAISDILVRAMRRETVTIAGNEYAATVLEAVYQGMTIRSWVDADGRILRQDTPMGWLLEIAEAEEAVAFRDAGRPPAAPDLLASVAVPAVPPIANPRRVRGLTLRLAGLDEWDPDSLATDRQTVLGVDTNGLTLRIRAEGPAAGAPPEDPAAFARELAASPFLQTGHPAIRDRALALAAGAPDTWTAARAINQWVFANVRKTPTPSLPSAADVMAQLEGDCNEHAYLATALARAAGIPARLLAGLVYMDGAFYYHAWIAVRVGGRWVEMDPTFGQDVADATHLALAEGELASQVALLRYIGRLSIAVIHVEEGDFAP